MLKVSSYDHTGKTTQVALPESVFNVTVNPQLIAQAVHVYRSNSHQGLAKKQTRGDVDRTTAKWYKQKGTGRARHGARSAPIFVGGGVAFGPRGLRAKNLKLTQKMKQLSLLGVLSSLAAQNAVSLLTNIDKIDAKTKGFQDLLTKITTIKKPMIMVSQNYDNLNNAASNLKEVTIIPFNQSNAYSILHTRHLIIDQSALEPLQLWLTGKVEAKAAVKKVAVKKVTTKKTK